mgnify:FL=1|jgi:hypothetical protein
MDITEVIELMSMVDSMENIEEVTVTLGDNPCVYIKKRTAAPAQAAKTTESELPQLVSGFETAQTFAPQASNNLATPGQVKFALDLAGKIGNGNMNNVVNGLAHALELTEHEILHPDKWSNEMTKEHASLYLDVLEAQHKQMKKQKGAWG